ncbi:hypothetical protein PIB30_060842 [Stylosanthes scabra]|uniref:Uncharacterized protein n=1 Tax=Stylosanthes scabra TaxID=79078 RepID=A0ABU6UK39_9FABA|nr:hypothetical protein [Stylosanthes scabra]
MNMLGLRDLVFIAPTHSLHHHHHHQQGQTIISQDQHNSHGGHTNNNNNTDNNSIPLPPSSLSVGLGIFPLLTATPCMPPQDNNNVHHHDQQEHVLVNTTANNSSYWNLKMCPEVSEHDGSGDENNNGGGGGGLYGPEFRVCQDCGNRAKKDCSYKRCRTCCKGRGYDCSTHVKSTWVPVSHRRARDIAVVAAAAGGDGGGDGGSNNKRLRGFGSSQTTTTTTNTSHSSTSNATTTKSLDSTSCHQDAEFKQSLPGQVRAPAAFKCHRVSAIGNGEDEITYLATVQICGHVFKGFLYDQGGDGKNEVPCVSVLQLGNSGSGKNNNNNNGECSSPTPIGVPITAYPASAC